MLTGTAGPRCTPRADASSANDLSFTATAERAGPAWSGRALGVHDTGRNPTAAVVLPSSAALFSACG